MGLILTWEKLSGWREEQRKGGRRVVATNGCFDLLHVGHVRFLQEARKCGDLLIVGVNGEADRAEVVAGLGCVEAVVIFPEKKATEFLRTVRPEVYVKGGDYQADQLDKDEVVAVKEGGGEVQVLALTPGRSTTAVLKKLKT